MRYLSIFSHLIALTLLLTTVTTAQQHPLPNHDLGLLMPSLADSDPNPGASEGDSVILSDVLGRDRSINIFAGFTRDFATVTRRFEDSALNTTILAPINSAIMALPRKPWEDPEDYEKLGKAAYGGEEGEERAKENLRRFVEAHVITESPWEEKKKVKTLAGGEVWWENREGGKMIQPGNIEVSSIASKVYNGEVWILKGVRNYA